MLEAAADFMETNRTLKAMHKGESIGSVVFAWPLTSDLAKAMGIKTRNDRPNDRRQTVSDKVLKAFKDGTTRVSALVAGASIKKRMTTNESSSQAEAKRDQRSR